METLIIKRESCEIINSYVVQISKYEDTTEQRRLRSKKKNIGLKIQTCPMIDIEKDYLENFYDEHYGKYSEFYYTNPSNKIIYIVRFDSDLQLTIQKGYWVSSFNLFILRIA